jgi:hypothetical protein
MTRAKHVLSNAEGTQSTPSSEKNEIFYFAPWRPFDLAQDMLGARIFVEVVLSFNR